MRKRQYEFRDGRFRDTWNEGVTDESECWNADQGVTWAETVLEICACGSPEKVVEAMGEYLTRVEQYDPIAAHNVRPIREGNLADLLLAYFADDRGLTEHGGSVYGAWLTNAGKRWLELWRSLPPIGDDS